MKTEREIIIEIVKMWPGHEGVNFDTTTNLNLLLLIQDAEEGSQRLIAAAPELLAALKETTDTLWAQELLTPGNTPFLNRIRLNRAAIAKAEGRE